MQRHLEAVKLVRGGARVGVGVVLALDLRGKAARPALDQGGGLHRLLGIALIRFHGGGVGGRLVRDVLLGLQPPCQLHGHLQRVRVVVLHRAPVDVQIARVDLRVDHAVLSEGRALVLALLAVVELDHEEAVDLLDLSHAAVIPFCPAIFRPGGAVPETPFRAFRLSGGSLQSSQSPSGCPWRTRPAASDPVAFPASAWPPVPPSCRTSGRCLSGCPLATARAARRMLAHTVGRCAVAPSCCYSFLQSSSGQWRDDADRVVVLVQND